MAGCAVELAAPRLELDRDGRNEHRFKPDGTERRDELAGLVGRPGDDHPANDRAVVRCLDEPSRRLAASHGVELRRETTS